MCASAPRLRVGGYLVFQEGGAPSCAPFYYGECFEEDPVYVCEIDENGDTDIPNGEGACRGFGEHGSLMEEDDEYAMQRDDLTDYLTLWCEGGVDFQKDCSTLAEPQAFIQPSDDCMGRGDEDGFCTPTNGARPDGTTANMLFVIDDLASLIEVETDDEPPSPVADVSLRGAVYAASGTSEFLAGFADAESFVALGDLWTNVEVGFDMSVAIDWVGESITVPDDQLDSVWWQAYNRDLDQWFRFNLGPTEDATGEITSGGTWAVDFEQDFDDYHAIVHLEGVWFGGE